MKIDPWSSKTSSIKNRVSTGNRNVQSFKTHVQGHRSDRLFCHVLVAVAVAVAVVFLLKVRNTSITKSVFMIATYLLSFGCQIRIAPKSLLNIKFTLTMLQWTQTILRTCISKYWYIIIFKIIKQLFINSICEVYEIFGFLSPCHKKGDKFKTLISYLKCKY